MFSGIRLNVLSDADCRDVTNDVNRFEGMEAKFTCHESSVVIVYSHHSLTVPFNRFPAHKACPLSGPSPLPSPPLRCTQEKQAEAAAENARPRRGRASAFCVNTVSQPPEPSASSSSRRSAAMLARLHPSLFLPSFHESALPGPGTISESCSILTGHSTDALDSLFKSYVVKWVSLSLNQAQERARTNAAFTHSHFPTAAAVTPVRGKRGFERHEGEEELSAKTDFLPSLNLVAQ